MNKFSSILFVYFIGAVSGFLGCYLLLAPEPIVINPEPIVIEYEKPVPYEVVKPVYVDKWQILTQYDTITKVDTVYIVQDYFTAKTYKDTLYDEKDAFIFLQETVYKNEIRDRSLLFTNRRPDINFWAIGGDLSTQGVSAGVVRRQGQNVLKLNVGYQNKPFIGIGYYRVIK
jgi:hypothetical protein